MSGDHYDQPLADQELLDIFNQVGEAYLHAGPSSAVADPAQCGPASPSVAIIAVVSITGAWNGHIRVRCAAQTAAHVAACMLETEAEDLAAGDIDDVLGELINILAGNI